MGKHKKSARQRNKNKKKSQILGNLESFDFKRTQNISNTAAIEERNEQILANLPKSRYKNDVETGPGSSPTSSGPGFLLTAEYSSDCSESEALSPDFKEQLQAMAATTPKGGLASLTALPGFSCSFDSLQTSKEFLEFTEMIKDQGYEQTQEFDEDGNLRSVSFTQVKKKKRKKKKKNKNPESKDDSVASPEKAQMEENLRHPASPPKDEDPESGLKFSTKTDAVSSPLNDSHKTFPGSGIIVEVELESSEPMPKLTVADGERKSSSSDEFPFNNLSLNEDEDESNANSTSLENTVKGAETEIGRLIEQENEKLLRKAAVSVLNCEDIAKHTAFLAEQRQLLKEHMENLQKKIRIHNSLLRVNGRNLLKHFSSVTSLEKAIFATKRDSIRFNIILNQFLSSPAYATMLESFERVTKNIPKNETASDFYEPINPAYSSFEDLLEKEKKSMDLNFPISSSK